MIDIQTKSTELPTIDFTIFEATPGNNLLLQTDPPHFTILAVTKAYLQIAGKTRVELVGKGIFDALPAYPASAEDRVVNAVFDTLKKVIATKQMQHLPTPGCGVSLHENLSLEKYWCTNFSPVISTVGQVTMIVVTVEDLTKEKEVQQLDEKKKLTDFAHNMLHQAPLAIQIYKGRDLVIEVANEQTLTIWGKTADIIGRPFLAVFPELKEAGFKDLMCEVMETRMSKSYYELPVTFKRHGAIGVGYFNFVFQPYYEEGNTAPVGVLVFAAEVTEKVHARQLVDSSEKSLELALEIGALGVFTIDIESNTSFCSSHIVEWFDLPGKHVGVAEVLGKIHPDDQARVSDILQQSIAKINNGRYNTTCRVVHAKTGVLQYMHTIGQVLFENGDPKKISGIIQNITNQVLANQQIEASERNFRNLIMQAPVAIAVFKGKDYIAEIVNDKYLELIGRKRDVFIGKPLFESIPEIQEMLEPWAIEITNTGKSFPAYELEIALERNGQLADCYFSFLWEPMRDGNGEVTGFMAIAVEVTDQVLSRKRVEKSELKIRTVIQSAPYPIAVLIGEEYIIELANESMITAWGKGKDVIGRKYLELLPELSSQGLNTEVKQVFKSGISFSRKNQPVNILVNSEMQSFYYNYNFIPLVDAASMVYGILVSAVDVTDLNLARIRVEESRQNLQNVIMQAPVAMCIYKGPEFIIETANKRMIELWGKEEADVMNQPVLEAVPEALANGFEKILTSVYTTGDAYNSQDVALHLMRNGKLEMIYVNSLCKAYYESDGKISGIVEIATEVTEQVNARHKIEEVVALRTKELAEVNHALQQTNRELEQFAYIASHDLQEPLRKVSTFAQMLARNLGELDDKSKGYIDKITASTMRMSQLIRDVLDFSQLSLSNASFITVDLNKIVEDIFSDFELIVEEKQAQINLSPLPKIVAVPLQMQQLFSNLISNALKFNSSSVHPVITITSETLSAEELGEHKGLLPGVDYYQIKVADNGIGFNEKYAESIFGIFQRLHGKQEYAGTGIGLALCKKIIQNHHGDIWATSPATGGSAFYILLPKQKPISNGIV